MKRARLLTWMLALERAAGQMYAADLRMCEVLAALAFHEVDAKTAN